MGSFIDMTGWDMKEHGIQDSFVRVLEQDCFDSGGRSIWKCLCSKCNKVFSSDGYSIRKGRVKSCGCIKSIINKNSFCKRNKYTNVLSDEFGEYVVGYTTNTNTKFYFDKSDFDIVSEFCWIDYIDKRSGHIVLKAHVSDEQKRKYGINKTTILFHQLIGCGEYDHIDRNPLNNRRSNLRICTKSQNSVNKKIQKNNKTGFAGVEFYNNKWHASIRFNNIRHYLGSFLNKDDAIIARLKAEKEFFGEFAPRKELFKEYGL